MELTSELSAASSSEAIDMISNLPKDVREMILAYLPTKDAGRTSILSSEWRHAWKSIPDLVIHHDNNVEPDTTVQLVDQILALHDGPIRKFDLLARVDCTINCTDAFDRWFNHLSRNGIKELTLQFERSGPDYRYFIILSSFLLCSSLSFLSLISCTVELPMEFQGLNFVQTLVMGNAHINGDDLEKLISNCPMLENLTIRESYSDRDPKINAPNHKKLYIGLWPYFIRLYAPELLFLCLNARGSKIEFDRTVGPFPVIDLNKFFCGVPNLEILELRDQFVNNLIGAKLDAGKFLLQNLKELWLELEYFNEKNVKFIQTLFHNAPNLQMFHLKIFWISGDQNFWKLMNGQDFPFRSLQAIILHDICSMIFRKCKNCECRMFKWCLMKT